MQIGQQQHSLLLLLLLLLPLLKTLQEPRHLLLLLLLVLATQLQQVLDEGHLRILHWHRAVAAAGAMWLMAPAAAAAAVGSAVLPTTCPPFLAVSISVLLAAADVRILPAQQNLQCGTIHSEWSMPLFDNTHYPY
jgi:hypothetical protein